MGRSFYFPNNPLSKQAKTHESARDLLVADLAAKGITEQNLRTADAVLDAKGMKRTPSLSSAGVAAPATIRGESYQIVDEHRNASGDRVIEMVRPVGGGRFEKVRVREAQAEAHTFVVADVRGGR